MVDFTKIAHGQGLGLGGNDVVVVVVVVVMVGVVLATCIVANEADKQGHGDVVTTSVA